MSVYGGSLKVGFTEDPNMDRLRDEEVGKFKIKMLDAIEFKNDGPLVILEFSLICSTQLAHRQWF